MEEPDELVPDEAWPSAYEIEEGEWQSLTDKVGVADHGHEHRTAISELIGAYRCKSLAYPEGHDPSQLHRSLELLQNHLEKALEKLNDRDVIQTLAVVERSYANFYSLPINLHTKPHVEPRLLGLAREIKLLWQLTDNAIRARMFDKRRGFADVTGFDEEVRLPASLDPPLDELVRALVRYWNKEIRGPECNYVDDTQDPPKGAPLTEFVHGCLLVAKARDRNGRPFNLINVREKIKRYYKKSGRANNPTRAVRAPRQGTKSAEKRKPRP